MQVGWGWIVDFLANSDPDTQRHISYMTTQETDIDLLNTNIWTLITKCLESGTDAVCKRARISDKE